MLRKMLKHTVVLFVLMAFFAVPASILFSAPKLDKGCRPQTSTYYLLDGNGNVTANSGKCGTYTDDGEVVCNSKKVSLTIIDGACDIKLKGYACNEWTDRNVEHGKVDCKWVFVDEENPPEYGPKKSYCSQSSPYETTDGEFTDCSQSYDG